MTKVQKIWLSVFLGMFIIPEIIWSPILNFLFEASQTGNTHPLRKNVLTGLNNKNLTIMIIVLESVGLLLAIVQLLRKTKQTFAVRMVEFLLILIFIGSLFVLFLFWALYNGMNI